MKKEVFVVDVDDYLPELTRRTLPSIERYAEKIGARFTVIRDRKWPEVSPTYEKMQVFERGRDNDWNILLDLDMYIDEAMYDVTEMVPEGHVGVWMSYEPELTIKEDEYIRFYEDDAIAATNFVVTSSAQHRAWEPFEGPLDEYLARMKRPFVLDEYCFGRNLKKYGYKQAGIALPGAYGNLFIHCNVSTDDLSLQQALQMISR